MEEDITVPCKRVPVGIAGKIDERVPYRLERGVDQLACANLEDARALRMKLHVSMLPMVMLARLRPEAVG